MLEFLLQYALMGHAMAKERDTDNLGCLVGGCWHALATAASGLSRQLHHGQKWLFAYARGHQDSAQPGL